MGLTPRALFEALTVLRRDLRLLASSDVGALVLRGAGLNASAVMIAAQARKAIDFVDGILIESVFFIVGMVCYGMVRYGMLCYGMLQWSKLRGRLYEY